MMTNHENRSQPKDYVIVVTTYWHGPEERVKLYRGPNDQVRRFATAEAAEKYIQRIDVGTYYLAHNEYARATYTVQHIDDLEEFLIDDLSW